MRRVIMSAAVTAAVVLWGLTAGAIGPDVKCQSAKLSIAGKYGACRLKAESKAAKNRQASDFAKCDVRFSQKWQRAESKAGGACPTTGDVASVKARITADAADIATLLANGTVSDACGLPATGQTTAYGPGSDGDVQAGATLSYTDNGDGTITDNNTGLMWEKKDDSGGIHDVDNYYQWSAGTNNMNMDGTIVTTFLNTLNDVAGGGANCFAGHCDWRIPNMKELQSIVDWEVSGPSIAPIFMQSTTCLSCTDVTLASCSCTDRGFYLSSTTDEGFPLEVWGVDFDFGVVFEVDKTNAQAVRAVRDGSPPNSVGEITCGDAIVDPGEQCDGADLAGADCTTLGFTGGALACDASCFFDLTACTAGCLLPKIAFVTSFTVSGRIGGLSGADDLCQSAANTAGLSGTFKAWLSDDTASPSIRFSQSPGPYVRTDGVAIALNWFDLTDGVLAVGLTKDQFGDDLLGSDFGVWTSTGTAGEWRLKDCDHWTINDGLVNGIMGNWTQSGAFWTFHKTVPCSSNGHLYCFEQ